MWENGGGGTCADGDGGLQVGQGCSNPPKVAFAHLTLWSLGKTTTVFCMSFRDFFIEADLKENEPLVRAPPQRSVVHEIIFGAADQGRHWEQMDCIFFCGAKKIQKNGAAGKKKFRARCKSNFLHHRVTQRTLFCEQKMKNGAAGKKKIEVQPGWCGQQPTSPRYSRSTTGGLGDGGGPFWIRHPSPPFFSLPQKLVILHERSHPDTWYFFSGSSEPL